MDDRGCLIGCRVHVTDAYRWMPIDLAREFLTAISQDSVVHAIPVKEAREVVVRLNMRTTAVVLSNQPHQQFPQCIAAAN